MCLSGKNRHNGVTNPELRTAREAGYIGAGFDEIIACYTTWFTNFLKRSRTISPIHWNNSVKGVVNLFLPKVS